MGHIWDLNPGDIIRINDETCKLPLYNNLRGKEIPIDHVDLAGNFCEVSVNYNYGTEKPKRLITLDSSQFFLVKQLGENKKRWNWLVDGKYITDSWSAYDFKLKGDEYSKFNWQLWSDDGWYHCPFCFKKLNPQEKVESKETKLEDITHCDCDKWLNRELAYKEWVETQDLADRMKNNIIGETLI